MESRHPQAPSLFKGSEEPLPTRPSNKHTTIEQAFVEFLTRNPNLNCQECEVGLIKQAIFADQALHCLACFEGVELQPQPFCAVRMDLLRAREVKEQVQKLMLLKRVSHESTSDEHAGPHSRSEVAPVDLAQILIPRAASPTVQNPALMSKRAYYPCTSLTLPMRQWPCGTDEGRAQVQQSRQYQRTVANELSGLMNLMNGPPSQTIAAYAHSKTSSVEQIARMVALESTLNSRVNAAVHQICRDYDREDEPVDYTISQPMQHARDAILRAKSRKIDSELADMQEQTNYIIGRAGQLVDHVKRLCSEQAQPIPYPEKEGEDSADSLVGQPTLFAKKMKQIYKKARKRGRPPKNPIPQ